MALIIAASLGVAAVAIGSRFAITTYRRYRVGQLQKDVQNVWGAAKQYIPKKTPGMRWDDTGFQDQMTMREAAKILNIESYANKEKITGAHRKLMILNHPDFGGSDYLASKINQAKDILLSQETDNPNTENPDEDDEKQGW
eukprot:TRINITY_DN5823_c0_g1_i1.p1 TRINITY_DN5823_c0_g1~~TRINITY_DN5823_c0_g1_i1.p1  ORF type:complete len:141 (-),score=30.51 TRINITY_DN5823_c0_g1_i1:63-485(-)